MERDFKGPIDQEPSRIKFYFGEDGIVEHGTPINPFKKWTDAWTSDEDKHAGFIRKIMSGHFAGKPKDVTKVTVTEFEGVTTITLPKDHYRFIDEVK